MKKGLLFWGLIVIIFSGQLFAQGSYSPTNATISTNGYNNALFSNQAAQISVTINNPGNMHIPAGDDIVIWASVNGDAPQQIATYTLSQALLGQGVVGGFPTGRRSVTVNVNNYSFSANRFNQGAAGGGGVGQYFHDITIWPTKPVGSGSSVPVVTGDSVTMQVSYISGSAFSVSQSQVLGLPSQVTFNANYPIAISAQNIGFAVNSSPVNFLVQIENLTPVLLGTVNLPVGINGTVSISLPSFNLQSLYSQINLPADFKTKSHKMRIYAQEQGQVNSLTVANFTIPASVTFPVTLMSFEGNVANDMVALTWVTTEEINNVGFSVERKTVSQTSFEEVGFVSALSGEENTYNFTDINPGMGSNVYRLVQIDLDGARNILSDQVEVNFDLNQTDVVARAIPTRFSDHLNIEIATPSATTGVLRILNAQGVEVHKTSLNLTAGVQRVAVSPSHIQPGVYLVYIQTRYEQAVCRVIKQ